MYKLSGRAGNFYPSLDETEGDHCDFIYIE